MPESSSIAFIGRTHAEFLPLLEWCADRKLLREDNIFPSISAAFASSMFLKSSSALTVVLQNYPDEFSRDDVNRLIGHQLFGRVFCCQSSWCVSTGRTHDVWPVVSRVTAATSIAVVASALQEISLQVPPLLPMAAPEDVFAKRLVPESGRQHFSCRAACLCSDPPLRKVAAAMLGGAGFPVTELAGASAQIGQFGFVLCDQMDVEADDELRQSLQAIRVQSFVVGMTEFPGKARPDWADEIVEKTELQLQLSTVLHRFRLWMTDRGR